MARKVYTDEFKNAAAQLVRQQGSSLKAAAPSLGVDPGSLRGWVRKFATETVSVTTDQTSCASRAAATTPGATGRRAPRPNAGTNSWRPSASPTPRAAPSPVRRESATP